MATNGSQEGFTPQNILTAMITMRGGDASKKKAAMDFLGKFQKSVSRRAHSFSPFIPSWNENETKQDV